MSGFPSTAEDLSRVAYDDEQYAQWERAHSDALYREAYVEWCAREDVAPIAGDPDGDAEWVAYLESTIPDE